jgi:hypothetical protein
MRSESTVVKIMSIPEYHKICIPDLPRAITKGNAVKNVLNKNAVGLWRGISGLSIRIFRLKSSIRVQTITLNQTL